MTTQQSSSLIIDLATEQLASLGYKEGEQVFFRALAEGKPAQKISAPSPTIPKKLEQLNNGEYNIYIVVNGGGDKDENVTDGKAIFYEHDDIPKEDQPLLWKTLGLPVPTFQIDTGGKSIHSYWVFDEPISVTDWKVLQTDLLNFSDGDRKIKNPSRVMRLAGFKHQETGEASTIVTNSGIKYSYDELRAIVPPTPVKEKSNKPKSSKPKSKPTGGDIPLSDCLAKSNRELLDGVEEPGRNDAGTKLARDLIGTGKHLDSIDRTYQGTARELFDEFCQNCEPPLDDTEAEIIWASAEKDSPSPSCQAEGVDNILKAWDKKQRDCGYYSSIDEGLVHVHMFGKGGEDGETTKQTTKIGNHLQAIARVDNPHDNQAALLLELVTSQGDIRQATILRADLAGEGTVIIATLLALGYNFNRNKKSQLLGYLLGLGKDIDKKYVVTDKTGWHGESFVLPHKTYGDVDLRYRDIEPAPDVITELKGDLDGWKENIGKYCNANSRLTFCLGMAFVALLLKIFGMQGFGFHLVGVSSQGKTIALLVAASVIGEKELTTWSTTANGLEAIAEAHNELLLMLDEIGQGDPRELSKVAYLLMNGAGKVRMTKALVNRETKKWLLALLSSGEKGMAEYMAEAGKVQKSGQEVRIADLPAVPFGSAFGVFETIHGFDDPKYFAQHLESACKKYRGSALDAFLARLVIDRQSDGFTEKLKSRMKEISKSLETDTTDHAVGRVAKHFALVQVALELAHSYGVLPFETENIEWSIEKMFDDWLSNRGGDGSIEIKQACDRIRYLLVSHQHSDRVFTVGEANNQTVRNLLAYKSRASVASPHNPVKEFELWVPSPVFDSELAKGVNKNQLITELQQRGWLAPPSSDGRSVHKRPIPDSGAKRERVYVFTSKVLGHLDECDDELSPPQIASIPIVTATSDDDYVQF